MKLYCKTAAVTSASFLAASAITRTAISSSMHDHDDDDAGGETVTYPDMINRPINDMQDDSDVGMHAIDDDDGDDDDEEEEEEEEEEGMEESTGAKQTIGSSSRLENRIGGRKGVGNGVRQGGGKKGGSGSGSGSVGQRATQGVSYQHNAIIVHPTLHSYHKSPLYNHNLNLYPYYNRYLTSS